VFQSVQHLLERELHAGKYAAVTAGNPVRPGGSASERQNRCTGGDEQWEMSYDQAEPD
jgi:hypothetical protein